MVARLTLSAPTQKAAVIAPVSAIASDEAGSYVMLLTNGVAARRAVALGAPLGSEAVEITNGLTVGDAIARTPQRLTDGAESAYQLIEAPRTICRERRG